MSTFVVRFIGDPAQGYRGRVRHVASGEESSFANLESLLAFFDHLNAVRSQALEAEDLAVAPATPAEGAEAAARRTLEGRERT